MDPPSPPLALSRHPGWPIPPPPSNWPPPVISPSALRLRQSSSGPSLGPGPGPGVWSGSNRSSLNSNQNNARKPLKPGHIVPDSRSQNEKRRILIQQRINSFERAIQTLPSSQKWPTRKAVLDFRAEEGKNPEKRPARDTDLEIFRDKFTFPIPVSRTRKGERGAFARFTELPTEIRLQIWGEVLSSEVRFIELQFCSSFYKPTFHRVCSSMSPLLAVCHESKAMVHQSHKYWRPGQRTLFPRSIGHHGQRPQLTSALNYVPPTDTIFFRTLDKYTKNYTIFGDYNDHDLGPFNGLTSDVYNKSKIRHLAIPFPEKGLPASHGWKKAISYMTSLRTLTFIVGCESMPWSSGKWVQLRDVEEWYADGRDRIVSVNGKMMDIAEVAGYLSNKEYMGRQLGHPDHPGSHGFGGRNEYARNHKLTHPEWRPGWNWIDVRVVAWRRQG